MNVRDTVADLYDCADVVHIEVDIVIFDLLLDYRGNFFRINLH